MSPNPYQPPGSVDPGLYGQVAVRAVDRTPFVLAAVGAWLAGAYWAGLSLLIGLSAASGGASPFQILLPCVLIVLYFVRGTQIWRGDAGAARRILWLHGVGGVLAVLRMPGDSGLMVSLDGVKVLIHVFGAVTAYLAYRSVTARPT